MMKIFLLTHERELNRTTNTGTIAIENANNIVERIIWQRVNPNKNLVQLIENNDAILLYSKEELSLETAMLNPQTAPLSLNDYENIIIIDSTWQEANKIFNQSPYLKNASYFTLKPENTSLYNLRANQPKGGLCTIECIIEVLKLKGQNKTAAALQLKFIEFNG